MRLAGRLLGFLLTFAAAIPVAARQADAAELAKPGASAARGGLGEARASLGQPRLAPGDAATRDLPTPFAPAEPVQLRLSSRILTGGDIGEPASGPRSVHRLRRSRAPPELH